MGKKEKDHRKRLAKRNEMIKQQEKSMRKAQEEFLKKLIEKEKAAGKFDNKPGNIPGINGPSIAGIDGPSI